MRLRRSIQRRARAWRQRCTQFAETPHGKRILKGLRYVLTAGIASYLVYQLSGVGWGNVWASFPRTSWFYVIFFGMYFTLPVFQSIIFSTLWGLPVVEVLPAAIKKRVYNKDVMGYSGDVFLYFWGRRRTNFQQRTLLHHLKDNAVVSSIISTLVAVGLLSAFFLSGLLALPDVLRGREVLYALVAGAAVVVAIGLGVHFRRKVFLLSGKMLLVLAGLHLARILVVQGLQVMQWSVVLPSVHITTWFTYLAVQIMVGRIPFLPSRDLIFMSVGIGMAGAVGVPEASVAGILGVHSVLDKSLNVLLFGLVSYIDRGTEKPAAPPATTSGAASTSSNGSPHSDESPSPFIFSPEAADAEEKAGDR